MLVFLLQGTRQGLGLGTRQGLGLGTRQRLGLGTRQPIRVIVLRRVTSSLEHAKDKIPNTTPWGFSIG